MNPRNEYVRRLEVLLDRGVVPEELANTEAAAKNLRCEHASQCHHWLGWRKWCGGAVRPSAADIAGPGQLSGQPVALAGITS